jgi:hypothetical protein
MKIETIVFSRRLTTKLAIKQGLTPYEIALLVETSDDNQRSWVVSPEHGGRLQIITRTGMGRVVYIALSPIDLDHGIWKCITAFSPTRERYGDE